MSVREGARPSRRSNKVTKDRVMSNCVLAMNKIGWFSDKISNCVKKRHEYEVSPTRTVSTTGKGVSANRFFRTATDTVISCAQDHV